MEENFAVYDTKYGKMTIYYTEKSIYKIEFSQNIKFKGKKSEISDFAYKEINEYFLYKRKEFDVPIELRGTEFQKKVYKELMKVKYGETATYKEIAERVGSPKGFRAVGNANNKNPLPIIVPCHRIVGTNGCLTGYAYGLNMKSELLEMENENKETKS